MSKAKQHHGESAEKAASEPAVTTHLDAAPAEASAGKEQDQVADETANLNDQILRLRADFDNMRRRTRREQQEMGDRIRADVIKNLLPVLDHFELGLAAASAESPAAAGIVRGFRMVYEQLCGVLDQAGVSAYETEGQPFDPQIHECISHIPSDTHPDGIVTAQTRRGYRLGDAILRPAQVVVSSGPPSNSAAGPGTAEPADEADGYMRK